MWINSVDKLFIRQGLFVHIFIVAVGKLKEKYLIAGIHEYTKRLSAYAKIDIIEVADEKTPERASELEEEQIKEREGERLLAKIPHDAHVIALAIEGKMKSSKQFAARLDELATYGKSKVVFVIGGSLGLSKQVMARADETLSFSKMTFPHQLMRLILLEQIYRAFRINRGEPYHK
nr:23S rRNA (pseudouridine(1915)-N(3))-methyltransferase RlmH [Geobacillus sp. BMUD]